MQILWFVYYFLVLILVAWHEWPSPPITPPSSAPMVFLIEEFTTEESQDQKIRELEDRLWWLQKSQCGKVAEKSE
jgi:hypothetical protein